MSGAATAIGIGAAVGGIGALGGAAISANAAGDAASQQAAAANNAANLQYQASQNALGFQENQFNTEQKNLAPWLQSGAGALGNLNYLMGVGQQPGQSGMAPSSQPGGMTAGQPGQSGMQPNTGQAGQANTLPAAQGTQGLPGNAGSPSVNPPPSLNTTPNTNLGGFGSLMAPFPGGQFSAPTLQQAEQTPGFQFQLQTGDQALQQSAAARGNLLTGGTAEALQNYGQGLAQTDYQNVYNNALNTYGTNYNAYNQQQTNQFNKLASLSGMGQQTASTLGNLGQNASNSVASNLLNTANSMGSAYQNAAAANASGIVGSANAWGGALGSASNNFSQLAMLQSLLGGGGGASSGIGGLPLGQTGSSALLG